MSIITHRGREKGFPTCGDSVNGSTYVATYQDRWKIQVNDEHALGEDILDELPSDFQLGGFLGEFCQLKARSLKRDPNNRLMYYLDLTYSTDFDEGGITGGQIAPDLRPTKWSWDFEQYTAVMRKDADGIPVVNSVGEPIELTTEYALPILSVERYQAFFDPDAILNYVNHRNSSNFWGASPSCVVCTGIRDREGETFQSFTYRLVTFTFKFYVPFIAGVLQGATELLLNCGHKYRTAANSATIDSRTLVNLAVNGTRLAVGATPVYGSFQKYPLANFDDLGVNIWQI